MSGSEPSDAIRVVNALLTQIDQLKTKSNVIVLTTSNITGAIGIAIFRISFFLTVFLDLAFVDRADIKQYIGPPSVAARYHILSSCISELMRVGIISPMVISFLMIFEIDDTLAKFVGFQVFGTT